MGLLVEGKWQDKWYDTKANGGKFIRTEAQFRNTINQEGMYRPESGRYHLYISLACPWAHRTLIYRTLKDTHQSNLDDIERQELEEQEAEVERHISGIVVDEELTQRMAQNHQARKILAQTDWYVVRKMETGKEIPDNIIALRMQARSNVVNE